MKPKLNLVLIFTIVLFSGCEDDATRRARKNGGTGQEATSTGSSSGSSSQFSNAVETSRAQHKQAAQDFMVIMTEFTETMESIKDIPSANKALANCDPILDKMEAMIKKVATFTKLKPAEKEGLEDEAEERAAGKRLERAINGARGHLILSEREERFNEVLERFKGIGQQAAKLTAEGH